MKLETRLWVRGVGDQWGRTPSRWLESQAALRKCHWPYSPVLLPGGRIGLAEL